MAEYLRQFLHMLFGSSVILTMVFFGKETATAAGVIALIFGLALSHSIKNGAGLMPVRKMLEKVERPKEKDFPGYGALVFFLGIILALVFSQNFFAALGAICILTFGDAFSNIVGTKIGKIRVGKRYTIEGTIGGITVSFIVLASFLDWFTALTASTIAMLSEFIGFEDNLTIPLTGAIVLALLL